MAVGVLRVLCHGDQIVRRNWMTVRVLRVSGHLHNVVKLVMRLTGTFGLLTAPGLLRKTPLGLPSLEVRIAIEGITGSPIVGAAVVSLWR